MPSGNQLRCVELACAIRILGASEGVLIVRDKGERAQRPNDCPGSQGERSERILLEDCHACLVLCHRG